MSVYPKTNVSSPRQQLTPINALQQALVRVCMYVRIYRRAHIARDPCSKHEVPEIKCLFLLHLPPTLIIAVRVFVKWLVTVSIC